MTTAQTADVTKALATTPAQNTIIGMVNASIKELGRALPKHLSPERLARIATTAIRQNPRLASCTPASFLGALFTSAQLGLEPIAGLAHLVPFNNSRKINGQWVSVLECQFILGYKGVAELFYRHERSGMIDWGVVHEKDDFVYELGTTAYLKHKPAAGERGKVIGYYCIYTLSGGLKKFNYMTREECLAHGKQHSKTYDHEHKAFNAKSPWCTNPDAMCLKTVMLQGSKTVPMSTDLRRALETDETSREYRAGVSDALDLPVTEFTETEATPAELPKADTKLTEEQIKAAEERAKKALAADKPAEYQDSGLAPAKEEKKDNKLVVSALIASYEPARGKGPAKFYLAGEWYKTFNKSVTDTLVKHYKAEETVELSYHVEPSKDPKYPASNIIDDDGIAVVYGK